MAEPRPRRGVLQFIASAAPAATRCSAASTSSATSRSPRRSRPRIERGVNVRIIVDAKVNEYTDKKGVFHASFPREDNLGADRDGRHARRRRASCARRRKSTSSTTSSWCCSTGGRARRPRSGPARPTCRRAASRADQRRPLGARPGVAAERSRPTGSSWPATPAARKATTRRAVTQEERRRSATAVEELAPVPRDLAHGPAGRHAGLQPARRRAVLDALRQAARHGRRTRPASRSPSASARRFKGLLRTTRRRATLVFMLLEKKDKPDPRTQEPFVAINA